MFRKYAAAILSIAVLTLTAFIAIPEDQRTPATLTQFGILVVGVVVTYLLPIVNTKWQGLLKTGAAIVAGAGGALVPLLTTGHLTGTQVLIVLLAGLNALAVEIGVQVRTDAPKFAQGGVVRGNQVLIGGGDGIEHVIPLTGISSDALAKSVVDALKEAKRRGTIPPGNL